MRYLELTLDDPASDLALDEALLEEAEQGLLSLRLGTPESEAPELLRIWEPTQPCVVLGRSSRLQQEVNLARCQELGIPILRRASGGATVVTGPGCLMYAVLLSYEQRPELRSLDVAHRFVMQTQQRAVSRLGWDCQIRGICDLVLGERKFSGNSLRCRRQFLLYHGTLLYDFPLELLAGLLGIPERQPEYRRERTHLDFVINLPVVRQALIDALRSEWGAEQIVGDWPVQMTEELAQSKYSRLEWTERH
jgi:lipoate-protein ligase A